MELCDVQAGSFVRGKRHLDSEEFWRLVSEQKYPKLNDFELRFCALMGRTCVHVWLVTVKAHFHSEPHKVEDAKSTWQPDVDSMSGLYDLLWLKPSQWGIHGGRLPPCSQIQGSQIQGFTNTGTSLQALCPKVWFYKFRHGKSIVLSTKHLRTFKNQRKYVFVGLALIRYFHDNSNKTRTESKYSVVLSISNMNTHVEFCAVHSKEGFTNVQLNCTSRPTYTTRSLVTRVSVTTWLAHLAERN